MYELSDYDGKSERVRKAMLLDDIDEHAKLTGKRIADGFSDAHFCNRTHIVIDDLEEVIIDRGIEPSDSLIGEIHGIYNHHLKYALKDAGFRDIRQVKYQGEWWYEFYKY